MTLDFVRHRRESAKALSHIEPLDQLALHGPPAKAERTTRASSGLQVEHVSPLRHSKHPGGIGLRQRARAQHLIERVGRAQLGLSLRGV
jgi:hypothetical protein